MKSTFFLIIKLCSMYCSMKSFCCLRCKADFSIRSILLFLMVLAIFSFTCSDGEIKPVLLRCEGAGIRFIIGAPRIIGSVEVEEPPSVY